MESLFFGKHSSEAEEEKNKSQLASHDSPKLNTNADSPSKNDSKPDHDAHSQTDHPKTVPDITKNLSPENGTDQVTDNPPTTEDNADGFKEEGAEDVEHNNITYTLESVSEEIDNFLSSLPKDEKGGAIVGQVIFIKQEKEEIIKEDDSNNDSNIVDEDQEQKEKVENETDKSEAAVSEEKIIPEIVDRFLDRFEEKMVKREEIEGIGKQWCQVPEDDMSFLEAVNRVSKLAACFDNSRSDPDLRAIVNRIGGIQQRAMSYLEEELRMILEDIRIDEDNSCDKSKDHCNLEVQPTEDEDNFMGYSDEVVSNLKRIAKVMIDAGFESECCQIYMIVRRNAFDECLNRTGFDYISIDEVQRMQWESLEKEIPCWIKTIKDCATIYFSKERKLAEAIFSDFPDIAISLFNNLTRGVVIQLLNFAEGVAMTKRSTEKLFKFLDMYEALRDIVPAMAGLFPEQCENELKTETFSARSRIGEVAISIFSDLENSIKFDTNKTPVPGGAVHPLTRYTMNYLKYSCEYNATLEQVFKEHSKIERADSTSRPHFEGEAQNVSSGNRSEDNQLSPFSSQLMRIMDSLDANLEAKSKLYRENALSCIFMMNNGRYILQKIKGSAEIHRAMGDPWCRKKSSDLRNFHKSYQRETWSKLLGCLGPEGLQVNGKVQKPVLKERFKSFNMLFDEIHKTQSAWVVSDEQLQSELRISISSVMIPAYRSFLGRFSQYLDPGRQYEKYIKYQPEDIETYIDELFEGNAASMQRKRP